jgi:serine/threonine protein phosphatase PrpC
MDEAISAYAGCAACIVLIDSSMGDSIDFYCANVGDSRAILASGPNTPAIHLSRDLKPSIEEEKSRIEDAGGFVHNNRVNGSLNMSRALGDHDLKDIPFLPPEK